MGIFRTYFRFSFAVGIDLDQFRSRLCQRSCPPYFLVQARTYDYCIHSKLSSRSLDAEYEKFLSTCSSIFLSGRIPYIVLQAGFVSTSFAFDYINVPSDHVSSTSTNSRLLRSKQTPSDRLLGISFTDPCAITLRNSLFFLVLFLSRFHQIFICSFVFCFCHPIHSGRQATPFGCGA